MEAVRIHPTAIVEKGAELAPGCVVGPYSVIGPNVKLGAGCIVHSHVVITGHTEAEANNTFFQFSSVGAAPQDQKYRGEESRLLIGEGNIIREYVTLQPGTESGGMITAIGNQNLFMANSHLGHDGRVGSHCWFANSVALAGHVNVADYVIVGGLSGIHQFVNLGSSCMIAAGSMVSKDVPPYCYAQGDRAGLVGINKIGLERRGYSEDIAGQIDGAYRRLFYADGVLSDKITLLLADSSLSEQARSFVEFIKSSQRGVCFPRKKGQEQE